MEQPITLEKEPKVKMGDFLSKNSDLPPRIIEDMISTNKSGFDIRTIDFLEGNTKEINRLGLVESSSLVHVTDYEPLNNKILPRSELGIDLAGKHRSTVHMTMGYPVVSHGAGNWQEKRFLVITPLKPQLEISVGYKSDDVILAGPVNLDEETIVREVSQNEREEVAKYMIRNGIIDRGTFLKLLTQDEDIQTFDIVDKNWQIDIQKLRGIVKPDNPFYQSLMETDTLILSRCMDSPLQMIAVAEMVRIGKVPLIYGFDKSIIPQDVLSGLLSIEDPHTDFFKYGKLDAEMKILMNGNGSRVDHSNTPWQDIERLMDFVTLGINSSAEKIDSKNIRISPTEKLAGLSKSERLDKAIKMVSFGGDLWKEFVGKYILRPKIMIYSIQKLNNLKKDLEKMRT